jgi:hypothetical protein
MDTYFEKVTDTSQLADLPPETRIKIRGKDHTVGEYADLYLPGRYPFLAGIAQLGIPIEVEREVEAT